MRNKIGEIKENFDRVSEVTKCWEDYENGLQYQNQSGLAKNLPKFVKFYEGDQWAEPTKNTKNLPRPVVNIIKMICRNKKSAILSTPVRLVFKSEDQNVNTDRFNDFCAYICKELGQEELDKKAVDDGVKKGSYFYHYYWDTEAQGKTGIKEGGLRCEIIDALNIFFANPTEVDEQKQKWILIASREDVESVKAKADEDVDVDTIVADESDNRYGATEQEGNRLVTVLTRYFRRNGEVFCEKATKSVIVNKPFSITPDIEGAKRSLGFADEDAPNNSLPDKDNDTLMERTNKVWMYPIVAGQYEQREGSIYGLGEVEGLIPNQKAINFNIAMQLLNVQENAWGKWVALPNALKGQSINNEPGQVLIDYSGTGSGIRKLTEQPLNAQALTIVNTLSELTRAVTGSTEVMTGETLGAGMSGAAIAQLQSQAQMPTEELKRSFWIAKRKQGLVMLQFFRHYYVQKDFLYKVEMQGIAPNGIPVAQEKTVPDTFNSDEIAGVDFDIVVETVGGTRASAASDINILDVLLTNKQIDLKTYLKAYPEEAVSNKHELIKCVEDGEQDAMVQMQGQLQQLTAQVQQDAQVIQGMQNTVNQVTSVIQENTKLKQFIAQLYTEARNKIVNANQQIMQGNIANAQTTADAQAMAQTIEQASRSGAIKLQ